MGFMTGKRVLIVGVASKLSIASGIAAAMHREGAELAFTYQNEKLQKRVEDFAETWGSSADLCFPCDVANDDDIKNVFTELAKKMGRFRLYRAFSWFCTWRSTRWRLY